MSTRIEFPFVFQPLTYNSLTPFTLKTFKTPKTFNSKFAYPHFFSYLCTRFGKEDRFGLLATSIKEC